MHTSFATAQKISCRESLHNPCVSRTRSAYRVSAQAATTLWTCNVTDRLLVNVTPRILIVCTRGNVESYGTAGKMRNAEMCRMSTAGSFTVFQHFFVPHFTFYMTHPGIYP